MRPLAAAALCLAVFTSACGTLAVRGGWTVEPGREPRGTLRGAWLVSGCEDASRGALELHARVFLVERPSGARVAVEARPSYDSLVIENAAESGDEQIFQAVLVADGVAVLRELRLPADGRGAGRLAVTSQVADPGGPRFRLRPTSPAFTCRLTPLGASRLGASARRAAGAGAPPAE